MAETEKEKLKRFQINYIGGIIDDWADDMIARAKEGKPLVDPGSDSLVIAKLIAEAYNVPEKYVNLLVMVSEITNRLDGKERNE